MRPPSLKKPPAKWPHGLILDVDGFLLDLEAGLGNEDDLTRIIDQYALISTHMIQKVLAMVPRDEVEWN